MPPMPLNRMESSDMSIPRKVMIPCPECGKKYQITVFDSLNTDYAPNLPDSIINGTWFLAKCPFCGSLSPMEYDFLYHDLKHNAMIWVVHTNNDSYYKTMSDIRATPVFPGLLTRIVTDMWSLREKVSCLESGKDDRVIEIYKVLLNCNLKEKSPDFHLTKTIYTIYQGKPTFFFYNEMDKRLSSPFQEEIYQHLLKTLNVLLKREDNQPYPIYDQHWAEEYFQHLVSSTRSRTPMLRKDPRPG